MTFPHLFYKNHQKINHSFRGKYYLLILYLKLFPPPYQLFNLKYFLKWFLFISLHCILYAYTNILLDREYLSILAENEISLLMANSLSFALAWINIMFAKPDIK
ncbi:hypothetical protein CKY10_09915 [Photorhabdus sp. HUG-39]|nr:hypothetical protein CKY10_09915 [Photorhabdus sp. HUG-39]